jgi:hypothetical protein
MLENEYMKVNEISQLSKMTARNVRKIISKLSEEKGKELVHKNNNGEWMVHRLLLSYFAYKRKIIQKYYALSVDPIEEYSEKDIDEIMRYVYDEMNDKNLEINYTVEKKKENERNHLHFYINCLQRTKLIRMLRLSFSNISFKEKEIFDLDRWKKYITKDGCPIKTIKN